MRSMQNNETPPTVGQLIYYHRRKSGLTQEAAAKRIGVSVSMFASWERDERQINRSCYISRTAHTLGIDPERLRTK